MSIENVSYVKSERIEFPLHGGRGIIITSVPQSISSYNVSLSVDDAKALMFGLRDALKQAGYIIPAGS